MFKYHISNGQRIFVKLLSDKECAAISTYPVLVFRIVDKQNEKDADFKLRKFVGYIEGNDWKSIYERYKSRIKQSYEEFQAECQHKYNSMPHDDYTKLVLSETFDEDKKAERYSLHPVNTIYGKVEYAI